MTSKIYATILSLLICGSGQLWANPNAQPASRLQNAILRDSETFANRVNDVITYSQFCGSYGSAVSEKFTQLRAEFIATKARVLAAVQGKNKTAMRQVINDMNGKIEEFEPQTDQALQVLSDPNPNCQRARRAFQIVWTITKRMPFQLALLVRNEF